MGNGREAEPPKVEVAPAPKKEPVPKVKDKPKAEPDDESKPPFEIAGKDDYQLAQAVNLLKGLQILQNSGK